jgi:UDP-3-O-[3-hydroxymyristoyl] N-acetylglucosamine deacetylase
MKQTMNGASLIDPVSPSMLPAYIPLLTVKNPVEWRGMGLHSGASVSVRLEPDERPGIRFEADGVEIPALADFVSDTTRCTVLSKDGATLATVEHLLAALAGLGIWSAKIRVTGPELPILDGSAAPFTQKLLETGWEEIGRIEAVTPVEGKIEEGTAARTWKGTNEATLCTFILTGNHPLLAGQRATMHLGDRTVFTSEIAPCRTWAPIEQVQPLIDQGLIQGGSLENAIVVYPDHYSSPLRKPAEPARHKLLDFLGDLALVGRPISGVLTAEGGGHRLNVEMARRIRKQLTGPEQGRTLEGNGPHPGGLIQSSHAVHERRN